MAGAREVGSRLLTFGKWVGERIYMHIHMHIHVLSTRSIDMRSIDMRWLRPPPSLSQNPGGQLNLYP
jgi:hypothetical protein